MIVFLSRTPFIFAGYGYHDDAWRVINAAREMAQSGHYVMSRPPGHPIQEFVYSLTWQYGPIVVNGLTAVFSALGILFFALILRKTGSRQYLPGSLALAFIPVVYINSTVSLDFIWMLAFILASFYFLLIRKHALSSVLLAFAIGCRITSILMLAPFLFFLFRKEARNSRIGKMVLHTAITGALSFCFYIPVYMAEGISFLNVYISYPSIFNILREFSLGVWGTLGVFAVIAGITSIIINLKKHTVMMNNSDIRENATIILTCLITVLVFLIMYIKLPHRAEYFIPAVPFVILLFSFLLSRRAFIIICILMIASPLVLSYDKKQIQPYGMIFDDHFKRVERSMFIEKLFLAVDEIPSDKIIVVSGWFLPEIKTRQFEKRGKISESGKDIVFIYLLDSKMLESFQEQKYDIFYIPVSRSFTIQDYNIEMYNINLDSIGVKPVPLN